MLSRRQFLNQTLAGSSLIALAPCVPGFLAKTARAARAERDAKVLVVLQLDGGNDGINTVVPFGDPGYARSRRVLRLPQNRVIGVGRGVGLHPNLRGAARLLETGRLAIVQGVGYPNPNRSHFESMAIWQSARLHEADRNDVGWIGRTLDEEPKPGSGAAAMFVGAGEFPLALRGRHAVATSLRRPEDLTLAAGFKSPATGKPPSDLSAFVQRQALDAYAISERMQSLAHPDTGDTAYPPTELGEQLRLIARLIKANVGARVFYARQDGYDTHSSQLASHGRLLGEWSGALLAFLDDLKTAGLAERVLVLSFSEFGRTVLENGSAGTDHGTAGPVFLAGGRVKPGLVGKTPSLTDLDAVHGDLRVGIDFRQIYAEVLQKWLGLPSTTVLGGRFERLSLLAEAG